MPKGATYKARYNRYLLFWLSATRLPLLTWIPTSRNRFGLICALSNNSSANYSYSYFYKLVVGNHNLDKSFLDYFFCYLTHRHLYDPK